MNNENVEKQRYSDVELQEFKELILKKLDDAKSAYEQLRTRLTVDESDPTFKVLEEGASTLNKEEASQRAQRQLDFIRKLEGALRRIENKTYGVCRITGKLIPRERLLAVPHTTTSVEGKEIEAQQKKGRR